VAAGCGYAGYAPEPRPIGVGDRFTLSAGAVDSARLDCRPNLGRRFGVHLELFVDGWVVLVPSGIGIRRPWVGTVPYVRSGACEQPIVTREPTGVVEVRGDGRTLGDLFAGGSGVAPGELAARYRGAVTAHVDGRPWDGDPRAIPLRRHAQIVLQIGRPKIRPHQVYGFPRGL